MSIKLKNLDVLNLDPMLREIALGALALGLDTITSAYRPGDAGVHGTTPLRGLDMRCRSESAGKLIAQDLNQRWVYDPERPQMKGRHFPRRGPGAPPAFAVAPRHPAQGVNMEFLGNIWSWVKKNPGKAVSIASAVSSVGGYSVAPWVNAVIGILSQAVGQ